MTWGGNASSGARGAPWRGDAVYRALRNRNGDGNGKAVHSATPSESFAMANPPGVEDVALRCVVAATVDVPAANWLFVWASGLRTSLDP